MDKKIKAGKNTPQKRVVQNKHIQKKMLCPPNVFVKTFKTVCKIMKCSDKKSNRKNKSQVKAQTTETGVYNPPHCMQTASKFS